MSTHDQPSLDLRVEDFLDDKLQSSTDLDTLPALLASVKTQQELLQSQLHDARRDLAAARNAGSERQTKLSSKIKTFQNLQSSIDARLRVVNESDAPNQAVARLQEPYRKRRAVRIAKMYLELLSEVDALRREARSHLPHDPKAALEPYGRLRRLSISLRDLQGPADDAAVHLVTHVTIATDLLWDEMKKTMSKEMDAVLKARNWPQVDPGSSMDDEWMACFEKLLDLQLPELLYTESVVSLLPFDVMCSIFVSEFRYHFLSDKPTSDPQAISSQCFPWFLALIQKWEPFFQDNLGHTLAAKFRDTSAADRMEYVDPAWAFITSMLPVMREKVKLVVEGSLSSPTFLSRFVGELMDFDDKIRGSGGPNPEGWRGLTSEILDNWFEKWFAAEKVFALERFRGIIESPEGRSIDFDYGGVGKTKPTYGATRVMDMLKQITSKYRRVSKFKHKIKFLIGIQIDVLDEFHDRLRDSLQAYGAITSTVGRTLHGVTREQQAALEGTGALETLCKVFGSSDHIVNTLKDWSNEEFFIELYDELQSRSKSNENQRVLSGDMTYEDVKDKTSTAVGSESDDGGLFDETIAAYSMRRKAAGDYLVSALTESHTKAFRSYTSRTHWTPIIPDDSTGVDPSQLAITPELDEPLRVLKRNLDFCLRALGTAPLRRTWRLALEKVQDGLWSDVLMRQNFTALGAAQFTRDIEAVCALVERHIPGGSSALATLQEGVLLLGLPVSRPNGAEGGMTLQEASDRVFADNTEAKAVLEELGVQSLTPANARHILQRRVENSE